MFPINRENSRFCGSSTWKFCDGAACGTICCFIRYLKRLTTRIAMQPFRNSSGTNSVSITEDIGLERVHRMGRRVDGKCRSIVSKFSSYKQREVVRVTGPNLAGKHFGISEQIPKEWQDRRKALLPAFKDAKKQGKRARFVGDKLLVEGHYVTPNTSQRA